MKNTLLITLLVSIIPSCKDLGVEPPTETEYYWAGGTKVQLTINRKMVLGIYRADPAHPEKWLEILYLGSPQVAPLRSIVAKQGFDPDQFEWLSFGYTHDGADFIPTNRISFLLKTGNSLQSLEPLMGDEAVFDSTRFGSLMLKVSQQEGNVFHIANRVQESGLVEYSSPDFLLRVTFAD